MIITRLRKGMMAMGLIAVLLPAAPDAAAVGDWYVSLNGNNSAGTNWAYAFTNIQDALDAAADGDTIYLAGHEFVLATQLVWNAKGLLLKGGYAATNDATLPGDRDSALWPTVLRQAASGQRVLMMKGVTNGLLEYVTLTGGRAGAAYGAYQNPGDYANPAYRRGSGLWIGNSIATLANLVVTNNLIDAGGNDSGLGGGIFGAYSIITMTNCLVASNRVQTGATSSSGNGYGGGVFLYGGAWTVIDCVISNNLASQVNNGGNRGGGLYMDGSSSNRVVHTTVVNNRVVGSYNSPRRAGGIYLVKGELDRCTIARNGMSTTTGPDAMGGGIYQEGGLIRNCVIAANNAHLNGGGIYSSGGAIESTTVADNTVNQVAGIAGVNLTGTTVTMTNSICVSNRRLADIQEVNLSASGGTVGYSAMTPLRPGTNNVAADVSFVDSTAGDYRLRAGSTGIDGGIEQAWMTGATDLGGLDRIQGSAPDIGAHEAPPTNSGPLTVNFTADTVSGKDAFSVTFTAHVAGSNTASLYYFWDFNGDGIADQEGPDLATVFRDFTAGFYTIGLTVTNEVSESNTLIRADYIRVYPSSFYVWSGGAGAPGTNWTTAFSNIATALPFISSTSTVYLAGETFAITSPVVLSDYAAVTIRGGYEATNPATVPGACDPAIWPTIIKRAAGSIRPLDLCNLTDFKLVNVQVVGGSISADTLDCKGGGLRIQNSSAVLDNCVFSNNVANAIGNGYGYGGGVYGFNSIITITNCLIASNRVATGGASSNGRGDGGGLYLYGGTGLVVDCLISNNAAAIVNNGGNYAGGLYMDGSSNRLLRTTICNNQAQGGGDKPRRAGGVYLVSGELDRCVIARNGMTLTSSSDAMGGGVYQTGGRIRNCLLFGNYGDQEGGGIYASGGTIENTTVTSNTVNEAGGMGGIFLTGATVAMTNSICVFNKRLSDNQEVNLSASGGSVGYSASVPLRTGANNTAADVAFMDAAIGDCRLRPGSAGIDAGITQAWMVGATDLGGLDRLQGDAPDMGAHEAPPTNSGPLRVNFIADATVGRDSLPVTFTAYVAGSNTTSLSYYWDFNGDGVSELDGADLWNVFREFPVGIYAIGLTVSNGINEGDTVVKQAYIRVSASSFYIWSGGSGGPGTNWNTAFSNLTAVLPSLSDTSTVYLAGETMGITSSIALSGLQNITILGGYEATNPAAVPGAYDSERWPTIIARTSGTVRVMDIYNMSDFRVARVTVAGGNIPADPIKGVGGGMRIQNSSVALEDCFFSNNIANCGGDATAWGGGIYALNSAVNVLRCRFEKNSAVGSSYVNTCCGYGGAIASELSMVGIDDCRFLWNATDGKSQLSYGGALYLTGGTNTIRSSLFLGNAAGLTGRMLGAGGAVYLTAGTALENCTIVSNRALNSTLTVGGGLQVAGGGVTNCIVWLNTTSNQTCDIGGTSFDAIGYSCSPSLTNGVNNNTTADPLFVDSDATNFHLRSGSPCRGSGLPQPWMTAAFDLDGYPRLLSGKADMGCYQAEMPRGIVFTID